MSLFVNLFIYDAFKVLRDLTGHYKLKPLAENVRFKCLFLI